MNRFGTIAIAVKEAYRPSDKAAQTVSSPSTGCHPVSPPRDMAQQTNTSMTSRQLFAVQSVLSPQSDTQLQLCKADQARFKQRQSQRMTSIPDNKKSSRLSCKVVVILILAVFFPLAGCGYKGQLTLPDNAGLLQQKQCGDCSEPV